MELGFLLDADGCTTWTSEHCIAIAYAAATNAKALESGINSSGDHGHPHDGMPGWHAVAVPRMFLSHNPTYSC
jgi:hypothetical protein